MDSKTFKHGLKTIWDGKASSLIGVNSTSVVVLYSFLRTTGSGKEINVHIWRYNRKSGIKISVMSTYKWNMSKIQEENIQSQWSIHKAPKTYRLHIVFDPHHLRQSNPTSHHKFSLQELSPFYQSHRNMFDNLMAVRYYYLLVSLKKEE